MAKELKLEQLVKKCSEILEISEIEIITGILTKGPVISKLLEIYTLNNLFESLEKQEKHDDMIDAFEMAMNSMNMKKPPLGLKPFYIHNEQRIVEIQEAIARYEEAKMEIPDEWVAELQSLEAWHKSYEQEKEKEIARIEKSKQVHIVVGERGSGKTTELIKASAATQATIVCMSSQESERIAKYAEDLGLKIPRPISAKYAFSGDYRPQNDENKTLLFDNIDCILNNMLGHLKVGAISITNYGKEN